LSRFKILILERKEILTQQMKSLLNGKFCLKYPTIIMAILANFVIAPLLSIITITLSANIVIKKGSVDSYGVVNGC